MILDRLDAIETIPKTCLAVPLNPAEDGALLRSCILVEDLDGGPQFIATGEGLDHRRFLGALLDRQERVHTWLEISVQDSARLRGALPALTGSWTNTQVDQSWTAFAPTDRLPSSHDTCPCPPRVLKDGRLEPLTDDEGRALVSATDDKALETAGLSGYSSSLERFLHNGEGTFFKTSDSQSGASALPNPGGPIFNPEGGRLRIRPYAPLTTEEAARLLGGGRWEGLKAAIDPQAIKAEAGDRDLPSRFLTSAEGTEAQMLEGLLLRLQLFQEMLHQVARQIKTSQQPMLNLNADAFAVGLANTPAHLPALWRLSSKLVSGGAARALPVAAEEPVFLPIDNTPSIYRPASGSGRRSEGTVRIRDIKEDPEGLYVEGTLQAEALSDDATGQLVWLQLPLATTANLYVYLEADQALAAGEWRFRSLRVTVQDSCFNAIHEAAGVTCERVALQTIPRLSAPADLYAMAILGVRIFCVNEGNTHATAVDEMVSLARAANASQGTAAEAIAQQFATDPRWTDTLGPHRLWERDTDAAKHADAVPSIFWYETLAHLTSMFPGLGPHSDAATMGEGRGGNLHRCFDKALVRGDRLLHLLRATLLSDLPRNREIHQLIQARQNT